MTEKELAVPAFTEEQLQRINVEADSCKAHRLNIMESRKAMNKMKQKFFSEVIPNYDNLKQLSKSDGAAAFTAKAQLKDEKQKYSQIFAEVLALVHYRGDDEEYPCKAEQLCKRLATAVKWLRFIDDPILDQYLNIYGLTVTNCSDDIRADKDIVKEIFKEANSIQSDICENSDEIDYAFKQFGEYNPDIAYNKQNKAGLKVSQFQELTTLHAIRSVNAEKSQKKISDKYNKLVMVTSQNNAVIEAALKTE